MLSKNKVLQDLSIDQLKLVANPDKVKGGQAGRSSGGSKGSKGSRGSGNA